MAVTLLGYFSTMVATLVAFMMLLNGVLSSGLTERAHHRPYTYPAVAQAVAPNDKQAAATDKQAAQRETAVIDKASTPLQTAAIIPAGPETAKQALSGRNQRPKLALNQKRKEDRAGRQQDQEYSLALGYAQEAQRQPGQLFDLFGSRRF
jgi:hypothetical protein